MFYQGDCKMFLEEFGERARECIRLFERTDSTHDRGLFLALARAWYGVDTHNSADSRKATSDRLVTRGH
jgi:hypothetical protein